MMYNNDGGDEMHEKIWEIIAQKNYLDELSAVKYFCRLRLSIDHDQTFQRVMDKTTQELRDNDAENLTFNDALDKTIENEKSHTGGLFPDHNVQFRDRTSKFSRCPS